MTGAEFLARYRETETAVQAYVAGLPLWVNIWRGWLFLIFTLGILFVMRKVEARWLAVTMFASLFGFNLVAMFHGVGRFPGIAFVLLWTPLAIYMTRRRSRPAGRSGIRSALSHLARRRDRHAVDLDRLRRLQRSLRADSRSRMITASTRSGIACGGRLAGASHR